MTNCTTLIHIFSAFVYKKQTGSRWVHQKCEERNGHECKKQTSYLCPDCRSFSAESTAVEASTNSRPSITHNPGSHVNVGSKNSIPKKRRKKPTGGSGSTSPDSPIQLLPYHQLAQQLETLSPMTPSSPISPGANFVLYAQQQGQQQEPVNLFDPNTNIMPCWSQLKSTISNLPPPVPSTQSIANLNKRKKSSDMAFDDTTTTTKKSRTTTTTITTTTTHRVNSAEVDILLGSVVNDQQRQPAVVDDLKVNTSVRKGKQTSRKMMADARSAAIVASSTGTPTTPTPFRPPIFATTLTTTTTVEPTEAAQRNATLSEEQFYQYQQLILQQQREGQTTQTRSFKEVPIFNNGDDGELSSDSCSSCSTSPARPVTLLQNTFGSIDKLGNFYGSFNEQQEKGDTSPYGVMDEEEDYMAIQSDISQRRPQKRNRRPPNKVTTTTTLTMKTTVRSAILKSKRTRERMTTRRTERVNYATSSETEESDYDDEANKCSIKKKPARRWNLLNISLDEAYSILTDRFPQAPVLQKMGSLWAVCEVMRVQEAKVNIS